MTLKLSDALYQLCLEFIDNRIKTIRQAIQETQASADQESKSSAGDKYETGLSMMQLDMEKQAEQLAEAIKTRDSLQQVRVLDEISSSNGSGAVKPGSAVETNNGNFYIAISAGQLKVNNQTYFAVSPATPIGSKLMGLKSGEGFSFNGKQYVVNKVH
ncbi:MAG TPA: 3-oxoacyl-ACP synthase [Cyclobacteriaceae bacterium]|nr:3-oxoacyl-ACP synthase [Cyclobacteriaceae bacterium]